MTQGAMLLGCALALQACSASKPVTSGELPGRFAMQFGNSTDSLELKANGEYRHRLWDAGSLAFDEGGKWTFTTKDGNPAVELSQYSSVSDFPAPHERRPGWWIAPVGRDGSGRVFILVTRDSGLRYKQL